jgi:hypothetical protein
MRPDAVVLAAAVFTQPALVIHSFNGGLDGVAAASPAMRLSVTRDASIGQQVLLVEYPAPTADPAGRDVRCAVENQNWTAGKAIAFVVKPDRSLRMSVSFIDRNGVVYTAWKELDGGEWQPVRIPFDKIQPNPYFQPPGAQTGAPIDVSEVRMIAFAPQDKAAGRLQISALFVEH